MDINTTSIRNNRPHPGKKHGCVISIVSVKGGVGKTTLTANLGVLFAKEFGIRCLVIDGDLNLPSIGFHLNIMDPEITLHDVLKGEFAITQAVNVHDSGLHVIPGSISEENISSENLKKEISNLASQYDHILVDTTPCLDADLRHVLESSDGIIIVSSSDFPSITASLKAIKLANELKVPLKGVVLNKVRGKSYELKLPELENTLGVPVIAVIPEDNKVSESLSERMPVVFYAPSSPASREIRKLAGRLLGRRRQSKGILAGIIDFFRNLFTR